MINVYLNVGGINANVVEQPLLIELTGGVGPDGTGGGSSGPSDIEDITGLQDALDGKAAASHTHAQSDITGLSTALANKAAASHTHAIADVTGLQDALDGKAATSHSHAFNPGLTQKGWWSFAAPVSGGYRPIGMGASTSITGSSGSFDATKIKKHGLCFPVTTTSGAGWRHAVEEGTRLYLYDGTNEFTGGTTVINFVTPPDMTNYRMQVGIGDGATTAAGNADIAVAAGIFIRASSNASDTNWMWYTNGASASTPISTGVPIVADCKMQATITLNRVVNSYTIRLKNLTTGADSNDIAVTLNISAYVGSVGVLGFVAGKDLLSAARTMQAAAIGSYCFGA